MKNILTKTFWQLLTIYCLFILAIALGVFWEYSLQFQIFALVVALIGVFVLSSKKEVDREANNKARFNSKLHYTLLFLGLLLILVLRFIPYLDNSILLGYDSGIYKYAIESSLKNNDLWVINQITMEPIFLYVFTFLTYIFGSSFILKELFILLGLITALGLYLVCKEFFNKQAGLIAVFLYALSIVQFKTFSYMYYRNTLGLILILFAFYFIRKYEKSNKKINLAYFIALGGILGAVHRPSFYIFGLAYFIYAFISPYYDKKYDYSKLRLNIIAGIMILLITLVFYIGQFWSALYSAIPWVVQGFIAPGESAGTFINFFTYQFSSLFYLPLALLGLFYLLRKKEFNILVIWAVINFVIVYFQFFFFNRFIIFLDLVMILMASYGASILIEQKKKLGVLLITILLISAGLMAFNESKNSKPLINDNELKTIEYLGTTEQGAFVMSTSSIYSPWIVGYSQRRTIAPGLFDYSNKTKDEWLIFWTSKNITQINSFMDSYQKPLYIFIGRQQKDNILQFNETACFENFFELDKNKIYRYTC